MELSALTAISPVDGRYRKTAGKLDLWFSEFGLMKYRLRVEIEYFIALSKCGFPQFPQLDALQQKTLRKSYQQFSIEDANKIKAFESKTNHDVKAVEYFLKDIIAVLGLEKYREFVHFGLTSQDINNTAIPLSMKDASLELLFPSILGLINKLEEKAREWKTVVMLARTHGQPASPTSLGKEIYVFVERLRKQFWTLQEVPYSAKFGGATGNFNAHHIAFRNYDWINFADNFVNKTLELNRSVFTTQIEHYDNLGAYCDALKRVNTILLDFCRDIWTYVSFEYFRQKTRPGEVGSSAMPHKVNPIDFENAEGNLGIANALLEHFSAKLPVSRLQRDLTDSTVLRNLGVPLAHSVVAYENILKGIDKLILNQNILQSELEANWAVVSEAIQTILRRESYPEPYEALRDLTRNNGVINRESLHKFINQLGIPEEIKEELRNITPANYTGINPEF